MFITFLREKGVPLSICSAEGKQRRKDLLGIYPARTWEIPKLGTSVHLLQEGRNQQVYEKVTSYPSLLPQWLPHYEPRKDYAGYLSLLSQQHHLLLPNRTIPIPIFLFQKKNVFKALERIQSSKHSFPGQQMLKVLWLHQRHPYKCEYYGQKKKTALANVEVGSQTAGHARIGKLPSK